MTSGVSARALRAPGRLVVSPTSLSAAYPYGGTEIGKTRLVVLQPISTAFSVDSEGLGEPTDILEPRKRYVLSCFLRGWDDDAIAQMLSGGYAAGSVSGHAVYSEPSNVPGSSALSRAKVFLYVPDDTIHVPAVLVYRGVPMWQDGAELALQRNEELGLPVAIECLRSTASKILAVGLLADLSL